MPSGAPRPIPAVQCAAAPAAVVAKPGRPRVTKRRRPVGTKFHACPLSHFLWARFAPRRANGEGGRRCPRPSLYVSTVAAVETVNSQQRGRRSAAGAAWRWAKAIGPGSGFRERTDPVSPLAIQVPLALERRVILVHAVLQEVGAVRER